MIMVVLSLPSTHFCINSQHFLVYSFLCPSNHPHVTNYSRLQFHIHLNTLVLTGAILDYALANYKVDVNRMYIGGFSSGSLESWAIAKG